MDDPAVGHFSPSHRVIQTLHISLILSAIGLVLLHDFIGLFWALGLKAQFSERFLKIAHRLIGGAFLGAVGTGIAAAISKPEVIRHDGFWFKMTFVAMLGVNGIFMGRKCSALARQRFGKLPLRKKFTLSLSMMLSLILWLATAFLGLTLT